MPTEPSDEQLIAYLKANALYGPLAAAAGVSKTADVGDVHKPAATGTPAAQTEGKGNDEDTSAATVAKRADFIKRMLEVEPEFAKGDAAIYVQRPLTPASAQRLYDWCAEQGVKNAVPAELLHVTQLYSSTDVAGAKPLETLLDITEKGRYLTSLGEDGKALVLAIRSPEMQARHKELLAAGGTTKFPYYLTHITLSYDATGGPDWMMVDAPEFPIQLGPEKIEADNPNFVADNNLIAKGENGEFDLSITVAKADPTRQMIFGWFSVTHVNGQEIVDKQDDAIQLQFNPADGSEGLEDAVYKFVLYGRTHGEMHDKIGTGQLVESMVFTPEKAALGIVAKNEKGEQMFGWWGGFRVNDPDTWASHKAGRLPEFSIGGRATPVET